MDRLCYISTITPRSVNNALGRSFFYRTITKWNHVPLLIRDLNDIGEFKASLIKHMWKRILPDEEIGESPDSEDFDSE